MKKQVVLIHGGDIFETYKAYLNHLKNKEIDFEKHGLGKSFWEDKLKEDLGEDFQVVRPEMPGKRNAKYEEWKIWFEKFIPFINDRVVLVGGSLGATFLAKYLSENKFPKKIKAVFLLAGAFGDNVPEYKLLDFSLATNLNKLSTQAEKVFLYHSKDDPTVPFTDLAKFQKELPGAIVRIFEDRGHFNLEEFPEIVEDIKSLSSY